MNELLYKEEVFQLVGILHRDSSRGGKGHDEVVYKDALVVELSRAGIPIFAGEKLRNHLQGSLSCRTIIMRTLWSGIRFSLKPKAVEKLTDSHIKQVLNYLAASNLRLGLLVNFGGDSLEWKRVIL